MVNIYGDLKTVQLMIQKQKHIYFNPFGPK